jgi:hypothetical protein
MDRNDEDAEYIPTPEEDEERLRYQDRVREMCGPECS